MTRKKPTTTKPKPRAARSFQCYPSDYIADADLALCGMGARGLWTWCFMTAFANDGLVLVGGRKPTISEISQAARVKPEEWPLVAGWIGELVTNGVCDITGDDHPLGAGIMISRRMSRLAREREEAAANGGLGGNPNLIGETTEEALERAATTRMNAAERQRRYREGRKSVTVVTRDVTPASQISTVTRYVTNGSCHTDEKRDTGEAAPCAPSDPPPRDGVNPHLNPLPSPSFPSPKEIHSATAEPRSRAPASPVTGAGARSHRRETRPPPAPPRDPAEVRAELERFAAEEAGEGGARGPPSAPIAVPPDTPVH